jgi:hypothetical protein
MPAMRTPVKQVLLLTICIARTPEALGFSAEAHRVAGLIAENHLCPATREFLAPLLDGSTLADAGVWADAVRDQPEWRHTRDWHFINVGDREPLNEAINGEGGNVLAAIRRSEKEWADARLSKERRSVALRFFVHLVVDVHQPLHVGRAEDRGGNDIEVRWRDEFMSLHEFWDARLLLRVQGLTRSDLAFVIGALAVGAERSWLSGNAMDWAEESRAFRPLAYHLPAARRGVVRLGDRYVAATRNVVNLRLAQAAVRLAGRLNRHRCPGFVPEMPLQAIEPARPSH